MIHDLKPDPAYKGSGDACVPSGLGVSGLPFLGLKPQALCPRPFGAGRKWAATLSEEMLA